MGSARALSGCDSRELRTACDVTAPIGFAVIDKPAGLTSHACVARIRRLLGIRRVGHGGTLDPAVTGVLPIAVGQATRLLPYLPGEKTYRGVIQLGITTSSDDLQGEELSRQARPVVSRAELDGVLNRFRGAIRQRPPQVSAVHVDGERAHARARRGEAMDLPERPVTIHHLHLLAWTLISPSSALRFIARQARTSAHWQGISVKPWDAGAVLPAFGEPRPSDSAMTRQSLSPSVQSRSALAGCPCYPLNWPCLICRTEH